VAHQIGDLCVFDPFFLSKREELQRRPARAHFAAPPFADENRAHIQRQSKGRLAHMRLLADTFDGFGFKRLHALPARIPLALEAPAAGRPANGAASD